MQLFNSTAITPSSTVLTIPSYPVTGSHSVSQCYLYANPTQVSERNSCHYLEPHQFSPSEIAAEMEARNNNIGYAIGRWIGLMIGTVKPEDDYYPASEPFEFEEPQLESLSSVEPVSTDASASAQKKSVWGFISSVSSSIYNGVKSCFGSKTSNTAGQENEKGEVVEFVTSTSADSVGAFKDGRRVNKYNDVMLSGEDKQIKRHRIEDADEICEILPKQYAGKKLDALLLSGHGMEDRVMFGSWQLFRNPSLTSSNVPHVLQCLPKYLKPNAKIIFSSCSTGSISQLPFDGEFAQIQDGALISGLVEGLSGFLSTKDESVALATYRFVAKTHPDVVVVAPTQPAFGTYVQSLDSLKAISPAGNNRDGFFDASVKYNAQSLKLIDKGRDLQRQKPWVGVFNTGLLATSAQQQHSKEWRVAFDQNQQSLAKAMDYVPRSQQTLSPREPIDGFTVLRHQVQQAVKDNFMIIAAPIGMITLFLVYKKSRPCVSTSTSEITQSRLKL